MQNSKACADWVEIFVEISLVQMNNLWQNKKKFNKWHAMGRDKNGKPGLLRPFFAEKRL